MHEKVALIRGYTHLVPTPDNRRVYYFRDKFTADRFAREVGTKAYDLKYVTTEALRDVD